MTDADMAKVSEYEEYVRRRVTELRESKGLKRSELSYLIDLGTNFISNIENGKSSPSQHSQFRIMVGLDVTPVEFFSAMEQNPNEPPPLEKQLVDHFQTLDEDDQLDLLRIAKKFGKK